MRTVPTTNVVRRCATDGTRWMTVITSRAEADPDAEAMVAAAGPSNDAKLALLFARPGPHLDGFVADMRHALDDVAMVGCTTAGLVDVDGGVDGGAQLVLLGGSGIDARVAGGDIEALGSRGAGARVGGAVEALPRRAHSVLLVLSEGLSGDLSQIVRGAYGVAGATVPLVGGCAGDDSVMERTGQFLDGMVHQGWVVGAAITSDAPLGIGVAHGWQPVGQPLVVTRSEGTEVLTIDDRPAMDAYLDTLGVQASFADAGDFARFAQTRPLGLQTRGGPQVRFVAGGDLEARSLQFLVPIHEGEMVWVMSGDASSILDATADAAAAAIGQLDGHPPLGVIAFDCVARRGILGDDGLPAEVGRVCEVTGNAAVSGFYTYGEIARQGGSLGFHHQTMVVMGIG